MMKLFSIFLIFFLAIPNARVGNAQNGLLTSEYGCINELYKTFNLLGGVARNSSDVTTFLFCNLTSIITCSNGYLSTLNFEGGENVLTIIGSEHINCFEKLNKIIINAPVNRDITSFIGKYNTEITLTNIDNISDFVLPSVSSKISLILYNDSVPFTFNITSLANFSSVKISSRSLELKNNIFQYPTSVFGDFLLYDIYSIPDLEDVTIPSLVYQLSSPNIATFSNFLTHNKIKNITISGKSGQRFYFPSFPIDSLLETLIINIDRLETYDTINISHLNKLKYLVIENNPNFKFGKTIPFKPYPRFSNTSNSMIKVTRDNFTNLPDFSLIYYENIILSENQIESPLPLWSKNYSHIKKLDVSNNSITGTIDKSYCNLRYLIVSKNQINTTILPSCFTCYFKDLGFVNNIFGSEVIPNFQNCTTLIPSIVYVDNKIYLVGSDLGFEWESIKTNDSLVYVRDDKDNIVNEKYLIYIIYYDIPKRVVEFNFTKSLVNNIFYLSTLGNPKPISIFLNSNGQVEIKGLYFSYKKSEIQVLFNYSFCQINSSSFDTIICTLSPISGKYSVNIATERGYSDFIVDLKVGNTSYIPQCPNDCSEPIGSCDYNTGICQCPSSDYNDDCSETIPAGCSIDCGMNGYCLDMKNCTCNDNYYGEKCEYTDVSIFAIDETTENGGITVLYGFFGNSFTDFQVYIGGKFCSINLVNESMINCKAPPGKGIVSISITINKYSYNISNIYKYLPISNNNNNGGGDTSNNNCINKCTSPTNGDCSNSICICKNGFQGYDCSSLTPPSKSNNTISNDGDTTITNQNTNYQINIQSLLEIDQNGKLIKTHLLKGNWNLTKSTQSSSIQNFIQTLSGDNNNCLITATLEEVKMKRVSNFAGINFTLDENSIKISISIKNYQYQSSLNTLQLTFESSILKNSESKNDDIQYDSNCNIIDNNKIEINNQEDQYSNYIIIEKNGKQLIGRIISRALSDGRSTFLNTLVLNKTNDSIITALQLPHCTKECIIDPDFQVLVKFNPNTCENQNKTNSKTAIIAGSVVGGVVFLSILGAVAFFKYKKNLEKQLGKRLAKMKRFQNK
ncbi:hypothetical protein RB653_009891 [Dictyostelium firmibasis]|uniref:EGF-like domain-containing protein n=1 Tax=Dictyostelium firmibasis TaxID=79012 RepID=A0AAN7U048_9MYCE